MPNVTCILSLARVFPVRRSCSLFLCAVLSILGTSASSTAGPVYTQIYVPGSDSVRPVSINAKGAIAGIYLTSESGFHGFVRDAGGEITTFDPVGSSDTLVQNMNDAGAITGWWALSGSSSVFGFIRNSDGKIKTFSAPASSLTYPYGINNGGEVTGIYYTAAGMVEHSFIRAKDGAITSFDAPGTNSGTVAQSINLSGAITGDYLMDSVAHGFVRNANGTFVTFDPPGSTNTFPININDDGAVAGWYYDAAGSHGFERTADGTITAFDVDVKGAKPGTTSVTAINDAGLIVGYYNSRKISELGFIRAATGEFVVVDPSGSGGIQLTNINRAAAITGADGNEGFVRSK